MSEAENIDNNLEHILYSIYLKGVEIIVDIN